MSITLNALNPLADINTYVEMATNAGAGVINPEVFLFQAITRYHQI